MACRRGLWLIYWISGHSLSIKVYKVTSDPHFCKSVPWGSFSGRCPGATFTTRYFILFVFRATLDSTESRGQKHQPWLPWLKMESPAGTHSRKHLIIGDLRQKYTIASIVVFLKHCTDTQFVFVPCSKWPWRVMRRIRLIVVVGSNWLIMFMHSLKYATTHLHRQ